MDNRFEPLDRDNTRNPSVELFALGVPFDLVAQGSATPALDLTPFVTSIRQSPNELSLTLAWHLELYGASFPKAGQIVSCKLDSQVVFVGVLEGVNDYRNSSGTRTMSLTCRTRDQTPAWREVPRVTPTYPQGTRLDVIARDIARSLGLRESEVALPMLAVSTPHSSTQLAQISAWAMLEGLLLPGGYAPGVDVLGRLYAISRDTTREPDIELTPERLIAISGARSRPALSRLQLKWLDPKLTMVSQQDRVLAGANITAGYFQIKQVQDVWYSEDRTQRAKSVRMVVVQSANGLLPVCSEKFSPVGLEGSPEYETHGRITLKTAAWVPGLIGLFIAVKVAGMLPDIAPTTGGPTIPIGKRVHAALELAVLLVMASIGTGVYEIWGTPYDYVNGRNTTEAYDPDAPRWAERVEAVENDFIADEAHAQATAGREFLYRALSANSYGVEIVDDLRVQPGDILGLPDGTRLYVTGYSRDLTHGAPAVLSVQGFQVGGQRA